MIAPQLSNAGGRRGVGMLKRVRWTEPPRKKES